MPPLSREMECTPTSNLFCCFASLLWLPSPALNAQAIVGLQGMGEKERIIHAIDLWECLECNAHHLFIPGTNMQEVTAEEMSLVRLQQPPYNLLSTEGVVVNVHEDNTLTQMLWIVSQIKQYNIHSLVLCTAPYHLMRACLTLIRQLNKAEWKCLVIPMAARVRMTAIIPELGITGVEMMPAEIKRILEYQEKGDVAKLPELEEYLAWARQHQPV